MKVFAILVVSVAVVVLGMHAAKVSAEDQPPAQAPVANGRPLLPVVPDSLSFCGERIPLERPEVRERLERELIDNTHKTAQTLLILKRAARWEDILKGELRAAGAPEDLFYLAVAESELANATSRAGAQGFWQFMPSTAPEFGLRVGRELDERDNPIAATHAAARYLTGAYARTQSWPLAAAAYNMGLGRVLQNQRDQGARGYFDLALNRETQRYLYRILSFKCILSNPAAYGFDVPASAGYEPTPCRAIGVSQDVPDLVAFAQGQGHTYQTLVLYNPWLKGTALEVPTGKRYTLYLPDPNGTVPMGRVTE